MNKDYYIKKLKLIPHPEEGGYYNEIYKDQEVIKKEGLKYFDEDRSCSTAIYYLLDKNDITGFHKIKSDELWHYYDGNTYMKIYEIKQNGDLFIHKLGKNFDNDENFMCVVEKNSWFSTELDCKNINNFVLAGITVSPGFDFKDFKFGTFEYLSKKFPHHTKLIENRCKQV
jgi:predicted cupin superfamily sugar epimerase